MRRADVAAAIAKGWRRIATNNAFLLDPAADVLCWGDTRWWVENRDSIVHTGPYKITWRPLPDYTGTGIHVLKHQNTPPALSTEPNRVFGSNTGHGALNIAVHFGVKRVVLLGFDMHSAHGHNWHELHKRHANEGRYRRVFMPDMNQAAKCCALLNVEVINCSLASALKCFPIVPLENVE